MKALIRRFKSFLGLYTALGERHGKDPYSPSQLNVRIGDGPVRPRLGYDVLREAQSGFAAVWGFDYVQGYNASNVLVEEYISIENLGVATRPYTNNVATGVATEITNGGTPVSLHSSDWVGFTFNNEGMPYSYWVNPNDTYPVHRHAPASTTSWTPMGTVLPPTASLTYSVNRTYSTQVFTGITMTNAAQCVVTGGFLNTSGSLNSSILSDGTAQIIYSTGALQVSSFKLDLSQTSGGAKDYVKNDIFQFTLKPTEPQSPFGVNGSRLNLSSFKISFFNTSGTEFVADVLDVVESGNAASGFTYTVRAAFKKGTRSDWSSTKFVKIECFFDSIEEAGFLEIKPFTVGKVDMRMTPASAGDFRQFAYAYTNATTGFTSGLFGVLKGGTAQYLKIPNSELVGTNPVAGLGGLGVHVTFTMTASSDAAVTLVKLYTRIDSKWVLLVSQADGGTAPATSTWTEYRTADDCRAITDVYDGSGGARFDKFTCGCPHKGCVIWGTTGGYRNIRWSRIGNAERFAEDIDEDLPDEDSNQGATFSLSDNYSDEPLAIFSTGDVAIIVGSKGIYAQVGESGLQATPPKRLPDSVGCANKLACCLYKDDFGNPGVAYLSLDGTAIYFALVDQSFDGISGFRIITISDSIGRNPNEAGQSLWSLMANQTGDYTAFYMANARLVHEPNTGTLRLYNGRRRVATFWPPSAVDGSRQWTLYEYCSDQEASWSSGGSSGIADSLTLRYVSTSQRRGHRAMDGFGRFLLMEYDWTDPNPMANPFDGLLRDGGTSILGVINDNGTIRARTFVYWQSMKQEGPRRLVDRCHLVFTGDLPTIRIDCDGVISTKKLGSGKEWARFPASCNGRSISYRIIWAYSAGTLTDLNAPVVYALETRELELNERVRF